MAALEAVDVRVALVGGEEPYAPADVVVTYVPRPAFLDAAWVHCARAGHEAFDEAAYADAGVPLTNSTGIHGDTVGELAVGSMLSLARLLHVYRDNQRAGERYEPAYDRPFTLAGERCCVVGLGTIGEAIAGAALDVFETEPLPDESPLWRLEDVIVTPHEGSATKRYHLDIAALVWRNLRRFRAGEPLENRVA